MNYHTLLVNGGRYKYYISDWSQSAALKTEKLQQTDRVAAAEVWGANRKSLLAAVIFPRIDFY